jgi:hypothetical protein
MRHGQESIQVAMIRLLRLGLTRQMRVMLGLIIAAIALISFIGGILVGGVGRGGDMDDECLLIRQDSTRLMEEARRLQPDTAQHRLKARTSLYQVINNRACFSAIDLATAQAALDELNTPQFTPAPQP